MTTSKLSLLLPLNPQVGDLAGAVFSPDRVYRYILWRPSDLGEHGVCLFIMLNPSTANELQDDPTVRRCIGYARRWGFRELWVVNLFAFRSTDPVGITSVLDPVGPDNDRLLLRAASHADVTICAWGNWGEVLDRGDAVRVMLNDAGLRLHHLGLTVRAQPRHPLYLPKDLDWRILPPLPATHRGGVIAHA